MDKDEKYRRAQKRVKELKGFYTHLTAYVVIIAFLFFIDFSDGGNWWVYWPAFGWGIAVAIHGAAVSRFGSGWEEKKIKEIMEEE